VVDMLKEAGIRAEIDTRAESIGYKIREANGRYKVPVQLIIGKNEVENREVNVRRFGSQNQESMSLENFIDMIKEEAAPKFNN
ncbi:MAG: His/Gly/Thr/Pro-type tRNA ligase C-terminal domain-containing protein, partial [Cetobacterium sp.]